MRALNEGHVFLPKRILCRNAAHILGVTPEDIEEHLLEMMIDRKIVIEEDEETRVYAAPQYHMEVNTARMLDTDVLIPLAPALIVRCMVDFIARRKETRFSNCNAMFSATN